MSDKPDDNYEDPADLSAIKSARENMGDYKLKSASDYVVPDHLRMNAEKAKARLLVLKDLVSYLCTKHCKLKNIITTFYLRKCSRSRSGDDKNISYI